MAFPLRSVFAFLFISSFFCYFLFSLFLPFVIFQFHFVQAMSALLCCGPCFDPQYLTEDGLIYPWLDTLLISTDDKVKQIDLKRNIFFCNVWICYRMWLIEIENLIEITLKTHRIGSFGSQFYSFVTF